MGTSTMKNQMIAAGGCEAMVSTLKRYVPLDDNDNDISHQNARHILDIQYTRSMSIPITLIHNTLDP